MSATPEPSQIPIPDSGHAAVDLPRESTPRKMRADAFAIFAMGLVATVSVITLATRVFFELFTPGGLRWNVPVTPLQGSAQGLALYDNDGPLDAQQVEGTFTQLRVLVPDVNTVSTVCLILAIALAALSALTVIASVVRLAWLFQQGRFFTLQTSRALRTITWSMLGGGIATFGFWKLGANGVEAALGVRATQEDMASWWSWYWIILFAVTSFGLIDIALRRAIRLQHETEGLV